MKAFLFVSSLLLISLSTSYGEEQQGGTNVAANGAICENTVSAFFVSDNAQLSSDIVLLFEDVSEEDCMKICSENRDSKGRSILCSSFSYDHSLFTCTIYRAKSLPDGEAEMEAKPGKRFFEKFCIDEDLPVECADTQFLRADQSVVIGYAQNVAVVSSLQQCVMRCLREPFQCKSAMYFYEEGECITNTESALSRPSSFAREDSDKVIYFQNGCEAVLERQKLFEKAAVTEKTTMQKTVKARKPNSLRVQNSTPLDGVTDSPKVESDKEEHLNAAPTITEQEMENGEKKAFDEDSGEGENIEKEASSADDRKPTVKKKLSHTKLISRDGEEEEVERSETRREDGEKEGAEKEEEAREEMDKEEVKNEKVKAEAITKEKTKNEETEEENMRSKSGKIKTEKKQIRTGEIISTEREAVEKEEVKNRVRNEKTKNEKIKGESRKGEKKKEEVKKEELNEEEIEKEEVRRGELQNENAEGEEAEREELGKRPTENGSRNGKETGGEKEAFRRKGRLQGGHTAGHSEGGTFQDSSSSVHHSEERFTSASTEKQEIRQQAFTADEESKSGVQYVKHPKSLAKEGATEKISTDESSDVLTLGRGVTPPAVVQDNGYFSEWGDWTRCLNDGERKIRRRKCLDLRKCVGALMEVATCTATATAITQASPAPLGQLNGPKPRPPTAPLPVIESQPPSFFGGSPPSVMPPQVPLRRVDKLPEGAPGTDDQIWSPWLGVCQEFASGQPCANHEVIGFESRECIAKDPKKCVGPFFRYCTLPC